METESKYSIQSLVDVGLISNQRYGDFFDELEHGSRWLSQERVQAEPAAGLHRGRTNGPGSGQRIHAVRTGGSLTGTTCGSAVGYDPRTGCRHSTPSKLVISDLEIP